MIQIIIYFYVTSYLFTSENSTFPMYFTEYFASKGHLTIVLHHKTPQNC